MEFQDSTRTVRARQEDFVREGKRRGKEWELDDVVLRMNPDGCWYADKTLSVTLAPFSDAGGPQTENGPQGLVADGLDQVKFKPGFFATAPMLLASVSRNSYE
jgi:hypothetical protein